MLNSGNMDIKRRLCKYKFEFMTRNELISSLLSHRNAENDNASFIQGLK